MNRELIAPNVGQERCPMKFGGVNARFLNRVLGCETFQQVLFRSNEIHTIDDFQYAQLVECVDNIFGHYGCSLGDIHDAQRRFC